MNKAIDHPNCYHDNLLRWHLSVLDAGYRYQREDNESWSAYCRRGILRGYWGQFSCNEWFGWINKKHF